MVQDAVPAPSVAEPVRDSAYDATKASNGSAPAAPKDEADDGDDWESASLYEEILDEAEAFEYSTDGESPFASNPLCPLPPSFGN